MHRKPETVTLGVFVFFHSTVVNSTCPGMPDKKTNTMKIELINVS